MLCFNKAIKCTPNLINFCILDLQFKLLHSFQQICFRFSLIFRILNWSQCVQVLGQLVVVDETQAVKDKSEKIGMCFTTRKKYKLFPGFFYSSSLNGLFCKVCTNFAPSFEKSRKILHWDTRWIWQSPYR